eukprot:scaffold34478_cov22-Cyclotella_meneghiniana.AAC.3
MMCTAKLRPYCSNFGLLKSLRGLMDYCAAPILAYYSHCLGLDCCAALILAYYSHCLGLDYCAASIPMFSSACVQIN